MKKIELKGRKLLRRLFGCISFTAVAFVFQACYGIREGFYNVKITGTVHSKTTNEPIKGIKVLVNDGYSDDYINYNQNNYGITDENGNFNFYADVPYDEYSRYNAEDSSFVYYTSDSVKVQFLDIDGVENGLFADTTIFIDPARKNEVIIHVKLENKD